VNASVGLKSYNSRMRVVFFVILLFSVPLFWDAYSSASANRGVQNVQERRPGLMIQIRSGGTAPANAKMLRPGETLYFGTKNRVELTAADES